MAERRDVPREMLAPADALEAALLELARIAEEQHQREKASRTLRLVEGRKGGRAA